MGAGAEAVGECEQRGLSRARTKHGAVNKHHAKQDSKILLRLCFVVLPVKLADA